MGRYLWLIAGFFFLLAVGLGVFAWWEQRNATVEVEWTTASELNTAGFNLYRSENPEGPFLKINSEIIPASSDPLTGNQYNYQDEQVSPGKKYYYQLEELEMGGASTRFGPISVRASGGRDIISLVVSALCLLVLLVIGWAAIRRRENRKKSSPSF